VASSDVNRGSIRDIAVQPAISSKYETVNIFLNALLMKIKLG